jgi:hypothetical protein
MSSDGKDIRQKEIIKTSKISAGITFGWYFIMRYFCPGLRTNELYLEALIFVLFLFSPILGKLMLRENITNIRTKAFNVGFSVFFIFFSIMWVPTHNSVMPVFHAFLSGSICAIIYMAFFIVSNDDKHFFAEQNQINTTPENAQENPVNFLPRYTDDSDNIRNTLAVFCFIINFILSCHSLFVAKHHLEMVFLVVMLFGFPILLMTNLCVAGIFILVAKDKNTEKSIVKEWIIALICLCLHQLLLLFISTMSEHSYEVYPLVSYLFNSAFFSATLYIILMKCCYF